MDCLDVAWLGPLLTDWGLRGLAAATHLGGGTSETLTAISG
jgi:hypothetical protein